MKKFTSQERLLLYKRVLKDLHNQRYMHFDSWRGLCGLLFNAVYQQHHYRIIDRIMSFFPEIASHRPGSLSSYDVQYWWPLENLDIRLRVVQSAILEIEEQISFETTQNANNETNTFYSGNWFNPLNPGSDQS